MSLAGQAVTVLGAGIAGLAVARALALRGASVRIVEQAESIREVGAGLQVSPNGGRVIEALGLGGRLEAVSMESGAVVLREHRRADPVLRMSLAGRGRFALVHRADLISVLERGAREAGCAVETGRRVVAVALEGACPRLEFDGGVSEDVEGIVVGADGLKSRVRAAVLGSRQPTFTGQVAWRALLATEPGEVPPEAQVFMGPKRHLVAYPLRGGRLLNLVAVEERARWADEGWALPGDPAELQAAFAGFGGPVRDWLARVDEVHLWGLHRHPVADLWFRSNAVLVGDAAHPTLPFLAQGACMALEDAWTLADCLERGPTVAEAFSTYQRAREGRTRRIVAAANANARNYHIANPLVRMVAHGALRAIGRVRPGAMVDRFDWLYGHDVTTSARGAPR